MILRLVEASKRFALTLPTIWVRHFHPSPPRCPRPELLKRRRTYKLSLRVDNDSAGRYLKPIARKTRDRRFRNSRRKTSLEAINEHGSTNIAAEAGFSGDVIPRRYATTEALEEELVFVAHTNPHPQSVQDILKILIEDRLVIPSARHYEALILGNGHPDGSLDNVRGILKAMHHEKVSRTVGIYAALLKVLAVHPDNIFRNEILLEMREKWLPIGIEEKEYIIVSMIREGQLELATTEMENLKTSQQGRQIDLWLWVLLIHALCDHGEYDAVLRYIYHLRDHSIELPSDSWLYLLKKAASDNDQTSETTAVHATFPKPLPASQFTVKPDKVPTTEPDVMSWIWTNKVEPQHINPSIELCDNVLVRAVKQGKRELAESAILVLEAKGAEIGEMRRALLAQAQGRSVKDGPLEVKPRAGNVWPLFSEKDESHKARFSAYDAMKELLWEQKGNKYVPMKGR